MNFKKTGLLFFSFLLLNSLFSQNFTTEQLLQAMVNQGCVKDGKVVKMTFAAPKDYSIKLESTKNPGNFRYFFIDGSVGQKLGADPFKMTTMIWDVESAKAKSMGYASNNNNNSQTNITSSCNLNFSKPKINFTLVDNRKLCRCCNERYAMYELNDLNKDKATAETFYLETLLKKHFEDTNADEAHQENDRARLNSYILENYGLIGSLNNLMTPILNQLGNLMLGEGKLSNHILTRERNIDKYVNKSDYCSRKCEILCSQ